MKRSSKARISALVRTRTAISPSESPARCIASISSVTASASASPSQTPRTRMGDRRTGLSVQRVLPSRPLFLAINAEAPARISGVER